MKVLFLLSLILISFLVHGFEEPSCTGSTCAKLGESCTDDWNVCGSSAEIIGKTICCQQPHHCIKSICQNSTVGFPCASTFQCFSSIGSIECIKGTCGFVRETNDECDNEKAICSSNSKCEDGICVGSSERTPCEQSVNSCASDLTCDRTGHCSKPLQIGNDCGKEITNKTCGINSFCSSITNKCTKFWSKKLGEPCELLLDACEVGLTCKSGICSNMDDLIQSWTGCDSQDDCLSFSSANPTTIEEGGPGERGITEDYYFNNENNCECKCQVSGKQLCEYKDSIPYPRRQQEHKKSFMDCLERSGQCGQSITNDILTLVYRIRNNWSCIWTKTNCSNDLILLSNDYLEHRELLFGNCFDSSLIKLHDSSDNNNNNHEFKTVYIVLIVIGSIGIVASLGFIFLIVKRKCDQSDRSDFEPINETETEDEQNNEIEEQPQQEEKDNQTPELTQP